MESVLVFLLSLAWVVTTLLLVIGSLPFPTLRRFHGVLFNFAKRGKLMVGSQSEKFSVPQNFFLHFYVVAILWTALLLVTTWSYAYSVTVPIASESLHYSTIASHLTGGSHILSIQKPQSTPPEHRHHLWKIVFLLLMMEIQALRRFYESIYVFKYSPSARMHIFGYLTGLFFYVAAPLSLCSACGLEIFGHANHLATNFIIKGKTDIADAKIDWWGLVKPLTRLGWFQWIGAAIFAWGAVHQYRCHAILGSLRRDKEEISEYKIPRGDWFHLVSCPHYLAEIVIYVGLLIASEGSDVAIWLLLGFVVANLGFVAGDTHRWYLSKFEDYPRSRRAILPFVY